MMACPRGLLRLQLSRRGVPAIASYLQPGSRQAAAVAHALPGPPESSAQLLPVQPAAGSAVPLRNYPIESAGLTEAQITQLRDYLDYLLEVNKVMNLTAVRDPEEAWQRHVGDSLALLPIIDRHLAATSLPTGKERTQKQSAAAVGGRGSRRGAADRSPPSSGPSEASASGRGSPDEQPGSRSDAMLRVIDVGTGAGLPGMVLAVARPQWKVTLLDSLRKRCDFLTAAAEKIGLTNVDVVWSRAEDGGQNAALREAHDLAVARAVAETRVLAELCLPFVKVGGLWVAAKGISPQVEVEAAGQAIRKLGGRLVALDMVESFSVDGQRTALVVEKVSSTSSKFPRRPGTPNADPL